MQQFLQGGLLALALAFQPVGAISTAANATLGTPYTQQVKIEGVEVYGQSAGFGDVNVCKPFARSMVNDDAQPSVTVCGVCTKVTVYLMNRCDEYHKYQEIGGVCDPAADSSTCQTISPATQRWMSTAQSYKIETCCVGA